MRPTSLRKTLAIVLTILAAAAAVASVAGAYRGFWGVPEGLTGGKTSCAIGQNCRITHLDHAFVRRVEGRRLTIRSLAPEADIFIRNEGAGAARFELTVLNVNPARIAVYDKPVPEDANSIPFEPVRANAIRFEIQTPPQSSVHYRLAAETSGDVIRFFVFSAARDGVETFDKFLSIVANEQPDFIIGLGDLYHRATAENVRDLDRRLAGVPVPSYLITGDAERRSPRGSQRVNEGELARFLPRQRFIAMFGSPNSFFQWNNWDFALFENSSDKISRDSFSWLETVLSGLSQPEGKLLFAHIPPFDSRTHIYKENVMTGSDEDHARLLGLMKLSRTTAGFFGHYRGYADRTVEGIPCYVTAAAGADLPKDAGPPHFLEVNLDGGDCKVARRPIWDEGKNPKWGERAQ